MTTNKTELIINATLPETRIAFLENSEIQELHIERDSERGIVGNIYKGKVIRVLPGMQAAFVDIGLDKAAFLYVDDIFFPEMQTPLNTNPLPVASAEAPLAGPARLAAGAAGPKNPRFTRGRAAHPNLQPKGVPASGTPEAHAMEQAEYARKMLDVEHELEPPAVPPVPTQTAEQTAAPAEPTPQAIVESSAETPTENSNEESAAPEVYRPEPIIDQQAWAEEIEVSAPQEIDSEVEPYEEPAPKAVEPQQPAVAVSPALPVPAAPGPQDSSSDSDDEMPRRKRRREAVNIANLVKEGQEILVQVAKDPIGTKGARLTCHVSLAGRYLVFMPTVDHIGVSRRIESDSDRRRLKDTISRIRPAKTGVIVRTASGSQTDKNLKSDLDYLVETWNEIQKKFNKQRTPSAVYQDLTIVLRAIRDMFTDEVDRVIVDSKREHKAIMKFVLRFMPHMKDRVDLYTNEMPIFDYYGIETEIERALERKVWLKSGGYLVVDQAEALVAIDVNTGRYVGKKNLEETILKTNLEAVKEIAYQLRLRNCGGIIILDLIDMEKEANREKVYLALEDALRRDRARPSIMKISQLGLIEMTRKRTRDSMVRALCEPCSYCEGRGFVKNTLSIAYDIMRDIEREGHDKDTTEIAIQCHPTVADSILEDKRDVLEELEHQFSKKISIRANGAYHVEQYELVAHRGDGKSIVSSSEERRNQLKSRIQARMKELAQVEGAQAPADAVSNKAPRGAADDARPVLSVDSHLIAYNAVDGDLNDIDFGNTPEQQGRRPQPNQGRQQNAGGPGRHGSGGRGGQGGRADQERGGRGGGRNRHRRGGRNDRPDNRNDNRPGPDNRQARGPGQHAPHNRPQQNFRPGPAPTPAGLPPAAAVTPATASVNPNYLDEDDGPQPGNELVPSMPKPNPEGFHRGPRGGGAPRGPGGGGGGQGRGGGRRHQRYGRGGSGGGGGQQGQGRGERGPGYQNNQGGGQGRYDRGPRGPRYPGPAQGARPVPSGAQTAAPLSTPIEKKDPTPTDSGGEGNGA